MIFKYSSSEFKRFRNKIFEIFREELSKGSIDENRKEFVNIIYNLCLDSQINNLRKLDNLDLLCHVSSSSHSTLLNTQNNILLNIYNIGSLENINVNDAIDCLYLLFYADIYESSLISNDEDLSSYLENCINKLQDYSFFLSGYMLQKLHLLWFQIPKRVFDVHLKQNLSDRSLESIKKLQKNEDSIIEHLKKSEKILEETKKIEEALEAQKNEYNFVSLSKGFLSLRKAKQEEMKNEKNIYWALMITIILIILVKFVWSISYLSQNDISSSVFIAATISTVFLLLVILYFFRISLSNIKSIRSQILQIDLRITLCQFIHNYNSDTEGLRDGMKESFNNFEKVIFAPIVATEDQIPNTFDGLDQITKFLGSITNKGK